LHPHHGIFWLVTQGDAFKTIKTTSRLLFFCFCFCQKKAERTSEKADGLKKAHAISESDQISFLQKIKKGCQKHFFAFRDRIGI
jgi:hypothetical protein